MAPPTSRSVFDIIDSPQGPALRTIGGRFLRITGSPIPLSQLRSLAQGGDPRDLLDAGQVHSWSRIREVMDTRRHQEALQPWPTEKSLILLVCTEPALKQLSADLAGLGADVRECTPDQAIDVVGDLNPALMIWVDTAVPNWTTWAVLDSLPGRGTAWLRAHREGSQLWVDPICLDDTDPTSHQVLHRRMAAAPAAAELRSWLHQGHRVPFLALDELPARIAGLRLLDTVRAWAFDEARLTQYRRHAWKFNTDTLRETLHPVLAYPVPAPIG